MKCEFDTFEGGGKNPRKWIMAILGRNLSFFRVIKASKICDVFWVSLLSHGLRQYLVYCVLTVMGRVQLSTRIMSLPFKAGAG